MCASLASGCSTEPFPVDRIVLTVHFLAIHLQKWIWTCKDLGRCFKTHPHTFPATRAPKWLPLYPLGRGKWMETPQAKGNIVEREPLWPQQVNLDLCLLLSKHRTKDAHISLHSLERVSGFSGRLCCHPHHGSDLPPGLLSTLPYLPSALGSQRWQCWLQLLLVNWQ